ncbi:hypothetical protein LS482_08955 [Sinomicrobium kalidii]|uniref:cytidylyltransferase domain-containing protein n=1 Tax=Sinomicrobium kalidii TaxID=2900738 RepID=UPI001E325E1D|nr:hypothetical protein [Sinomicrobium kalidii]UGU17997.1 hypothetical protein LS482_08955 [Sinomicrobium kalidii]
MDLLKTSLGIIVQARSGSSRLPRKMTNCYFRNIPLIEFILKRLIEEVKGPKIILATTDTPKDDPLVEIAKNYTKLIYRGDEENVLLRFILAAEKYNIKHIVRICADNPFINTDLILELINEADSQVDYVSYRIGKIPSILTHWGLFAEYVTLDSLKIAFQKITTPAHMEHVTQYIYQNENIFNVKWLEINNLSFNRNDIRLTLDDKNDYNNLIQIFNKLGSNDFNDIQSIISIVDSNKDLQAKMINQINTHTK